MIANFWLGEGGRWNTALAPSDLHESLFCMRATLALR